MVCTPMSSDALDRMNKARRYLRLFLMDTPALNRLILKEESDDEVLTFAIEMAISDWNSSSPILPPITIVNYNSLYLLMHGATIQVLKSQGLLQARNQLSYSAGGSSFSRNDKSAMYQSWMVNFVNDYEVKKRNLKVHCNIKRGWGGVNSEYERIGYAW